MRLLAPAAVLAVLSLVACEPPPPPVPGALDRTGDVLSVVNGTNVTQGMVDARLSQMPERQRDQIVASGKMSQLKDAVVTEEVLYQEAVKRKLYEQADVKAAIALAARQAMITELIEGEAEKRADDAAAQAYYDEHKVQFARPQVKARHILIRAEAAPGANGRPGEPTPAALKAAEAEAKAILEEAKSGKDFSELAKAKSKDPGSAAKGGDLGWFEKGRMVPEFADAAFAGEKGKLVDQVIKSQFGYHIIMVDDKRDATPFEEVKDQLKDTVKGEQARKFVDELKAAATITSPAGAGGATVEPAAGGAAPAAPAAPSAPAGGEAPAAK